MELVRHWHNNCSEMRDQTRQTWEAKWNLSKKLLSATVKMICTNGPWLTNTASTAIVTINTEARVAVDMIHTCRVVSTWYAWTLVDILMWKRKKWNRCRVMFNLMEWCQSQCGADWLQYKCKWSFQQRIFLDQRTLNVSDLLLTLWVCSVKLIFTAYTQP